MGVAIYGNYGGPILAFPTSMGDESEMEGQGMIRTLSPYIEEGRIRIFCINGVQSDSFSNKGAHPFHRSWMQAQYDDYVANEVFPFIDSQCQTPGIGIATLGASLGAYHAANTLFKHPDHVKRCYALSCVYDMRDSMDGMYDDNFYFNNPVDSMASEHDHWFFTSRRARALLPSKKCLAKPEKYCQSHCRRRAHKSFRGTIRGSRTSVSASIAQGPSPDFLYSVVDPQPLAYRKRGLT